MASSIGGRALVLVVVLAGICVGQASAEASVCKDDPKDVRARTYRLGLTAQADGPLVFAHAPEVELPAVSKDGKLVAELFEDSEDFSGAPITSLVIWNRDGVAVL